MLGKCMFVIIYGFYLYGMMAWSYLGLVSVNETSTSHFGLTWVYVINDETQKRP
jgi:hypothetical protein